MRRFWLRGRSRGWRRWRPEARVSPIALGSGSVLARVPPGILSSRKTFSTHCENCSLSLNFRDQGASGLVFFLVGAFHLRSGRLRSSVQLCSSSIVIKVRSSLLSPTYGGARPETGGVVGAIDSGGGLGDWIRTAPSYIVWDVAVASITVRGPVGLRCLVSAVCGCGGVMTFADTRRALRLRHYFVAAL